MSPENNFSPADDQPLCSIQLSPPLYNALIRAGVTTIGQLKNYSLLEISKFRRIGKKGMEELQERCASMQIHLLKEPTDYFPDSPLKKALKDTTIILFRQAEIATLEELSSHSTEELFLWCGEDIYQTVKIYFELKSAGISMCMACPPFLFECLDLPLVTRNRLFWYKIYRMDQLMALDEIDLRSMRELGVKRVQKILREKEKYSFQIKGSV